MITLIAGVSLAFGLTATVLSMSRVTNRTVTRTANKGESFYLAEAGLNTLMNSAKQAVQAGSTLPTNLGSTTMRTRDGKLIGTYEASVTGTSLSSSTRTEYPSASDTVTVTDRTYRFTVEGRGEAFGSIQSVVQRTCQITRTRRHHRTEQWVNTAHFCAPPTYELFVTEWNEDSTGPLTSSWFQVR